MKERQSLAHVGWECKYHLVFVAKYRRKVLYGRTRQQIGKILQQLCRQKEWRFSKDMRCLTRPYDIEDFPEVQCCDGCQGT